LPEYGSRFLNRKIVLTDTSFAVAAFYLLYCVFYLIRSCI
jgi:hypothetical protein